MFQEPAEDTTTDTTVNYTTKTRYIVVPGTTDGILSDSVPGDGTLELTNTGATDFAAAGVTTSDMVRITSEGTAGVAVLGMYKVLSVATVEIRLDSGDQDDSTGTGLSFEIMEPGMYLQYKDATGATVTASGPPTIEYISDSTCVRSTGDWEADGYEVGMAVTTTAPTNAGTYTIASFPNATTMIFVEKTITAEGPLSDSHTVDGVGGFYRTLGSNTYPFHWRLFGNSADLGESFQYIQRQLRRTTDVDESDGVARGDVTDLLMTFASPTGVALDMFIDDLDSGDFNNATFNDVSGTARNYPFVAGITVTLNSNITSSTDCKVIIFFTNNDAGDNDGSDFGTKDAIIVQDTGSSDMTSQEPNIDLSFSYDYDNNVQRGSGSGNTPIPITIVAIGTDLAQYVQTDGTVQRQNVNTFALVSPLERNYSNP